MICRRVSPAPERPSRTRTPPDAVNFTALLSSCESTWPRRSESISTAGSAAGSTSTSSVSPLASAAGRCRSAAALSSRPSRARVGASSTLPASSWAKVSRSQSWSLSARAESRMPPTICRWSSFKSARSSASARPSTPFSGVRISWLRLARKSLLALLAASARPSARRSAWACSFISVMSTLRPMTPPSEVARSSIISQRPSEMRCSWRTPGFCIRAMRSAIHTSSRPIASG